MLNKGIPLFFSPSYWPSSEFFPWDFVYILNYISVSSNHCLVFKAIIKSALFILKFRYSLYFQDIE